MSVPDAEAPEEVVWNGRWLVGKRRGRWEYVGRVGGREAAVVLAIDGDHVLLIDQYRVPLGRRCLELPAGLVDPGEDAATAAARELEEETGYRAGRIVPLGEFASSPGMVSEGFTLVRADALAQVSAGGGDADEGIRVHRVPLNAVAEYVAARRAEGMAIDAKLLLLLAADYLKLSA